MQSGAKNLALSSGRSPTWLVISPLSSSRLCNRRIKLYTTSQKGIGPNAQTNCFNYSFCSTENSKKKLENAMIIIIMEFDLKKFEKMSEGRETDEISSRPCGSCFFLF